MKSRIRLTESQLNRIIAEAVSDELNEGWFGDKWNQAKSAASTMFNVGNSDKASERNAGLSMSDRFSNARKNWSTQGQLNGLNNFAETCRKAIEEYGLDPNMTLNDILNRVKMKSLNRQSQISKKGGRGY